MLPLASFLLAALLGQSFLSNADPPPCVAANVRGCLPGYVLKYNRWGVAVYMRDPNYVPPLAQSGPTPLRSLPSEVAVPARTASWADSSWADSFTRTQRPAAQSERKA